MCGNIWVATGSFTRKSLLLLRPDLMMCKHSDLVTWSTMVPSHSSRCWAKNSLYITAKIPTNQTRISSVVEVYLHAIFTYSVYRPYFGPKIQYRCCTCSVRNKYLLYMYCTLKIFIKLLPYLYTID